MLGAEGDLRNCCILSGAASCVQAIERLAPDIAILDSTVPELIALNSSVFNPADGSIRLVCFVPSEDYGPLLPDTFDGCSVA